MSTQTIFLLLSILLLICAAANWRHFYMKYKNAKIGEMLTDVIFHPFTSGSMYQSKYNDYKEVNNKPADFEDALSLALTRNIRLNKKDWEKIMYTLTQLDVFYGENLPGDKERYHMINRILNDNYVEIISAYKNSILSSATRDMADSREMRLRTLFDKYGVSGRVPSSIELLKV